MKHTFLLSTMILLVVFGAGCKKISGGGDGTLPTGDKFVVGTREASDVTLNSARLNGYLFMESEKYVPTRAYFLLIDNAHVDKGDAYYPTVEQMIAGGAQTVEVTEAMTGTGLERAFHADATSLKIRTWYFCCAFVEYGDEVYHSGVVSFWTASADIEDLAVSNVTASAMTVSFRYEGDDVSEAKLEWKANGGSFSGQMGAGAYTVDNHVYTFRMEGLYPNLKYNIEVKILTTDGYEKSRLISENTLKGIITDEIKILSSTSVKVVVRAWPNAYAPTLYYSSNAYTIIEDYKSAPKASMTVVAGPDNSLFETTLTGLIPGIKYWFLADHPEVVMEEPDSFTTPN